MKNLLSNVCIGINLILLLSTPALAVTQEDLLTTIFGQLQWYILIAFILAVVVGVYFGKFQDRHHSPLKQVIENGKPIHAVELGTTVTECVKLMATKNVGALLVMEGGNLVGIFTERDALNRVLARGLEPVSTDVSLVMSRNPYCMPPTATVGEAMKVMTLQRFRHLPIVSDGKVVAIVSSGDLTAWLRKYKEEDLQDLAYLNVGPE